MVTPHEFVIPAVDGRPLAARCFEPRTRATAQVVVHSATAVAQTYYAAWADHVASRGIRVVTYDYRGIAGSRTLPLRSEPVQMRDWIDDAAVAQRFVADLDRTVPLVAVGHSFGGQVAAALSPRASALVMVGAQNGYYGAHAWPKRTRFRWLMQGAMPALSAVFGHVPAWTGLGQDLPAGVARQWARWCASPNYFLSELPQLRTRLAEYRGPVLALSFTDDQLAPLANIQWLLDRLEGAVVDHRHIAPRETGLDRIDHFGFFRRTNGPMLWPFVDAFLDRVTGMPVPQRTWEEEVLADLAYGR